MLWREDKTGCCFEKGETAVDLKTARTYYDNTVEKKKREQSSEHGYPIKQQCTESKAQEGGGAALD